MAGIKVEDVAYVSFGCPDFAELRDFLTNFGISNVIEEGGRLFARGLGSAPFLYSAEVGPPRFVGFGFRAASLADLERLAAAEGVPVHPLAAPGGGALITLVDPDGFRVDVVAGQAPAAELPAPVDPSWNSARAHDRVGRLKRVPRRPSHVVRLGHVVLCVTDFRRSEAWYKARFGLITSDEIEVSPNVSQAAFLRCDRGETPTDHHSLFIRQTPDAALDHAAFEVVDLDDLMAGHDHLKTAGQAHFWGVGRHVVGGQVFDYWRDPWGHTLEHWTDGDLLTAASGSKVTPSSESRAVQWGAPVPF